MISIQQLVSPAIARPVKKLFEYRSAFLSFAAREIRVRYAGTALGLLWPLIQPLSTFLVYVLVFGVFLRVRTTIDASLFDFALYVSAGFFPWAFFSGTLQRAATSIVDNRNYIKKVAFPAEVFPLATVCSDTVFLLVSLSIVALFSFFENGFSFFIFLLPFVILAHIIFTVGCALFTAAATVYYRDIPHLLHSGFLIWFFLTPIAYTLGTVPETLTLFLYLNPMYYLIEMYRLALLHSSVFDARALLFFFAFAAVVFLGSLVFFQRAKRHFSELV